MIVWVLYAKFVRGKANFIDVLTGSVAGLATITPCAGYINPAAAVLVGLAAGSSVMWLLVFKKDWLG